jgi:MerR family transcriptional regulator, light-induced transcriptional regulator
MQKAILSTADVARLFDVTETTVKRWADEGSLKCQRTPGGHRKYLIRFVIEFAEKNNLEPLGVLDIPEDDESWRDVKLAVLERDMASLASAFFVRAVAGVTEEIAYFLSYLYQHKIPLSQIFDDVVHVAMHRIGVAWERGDLTVDQEHQASYATTEAMIHLQSEVNTKPPKGKTALFASVGNELHDLGLRCASMIFRAEGWDVCFLGARIPVEAVVGAIQRVEPHMVCLSVSTADDDERRGPLLRALSEAARSHSAQVILGGRATAPHAPNNDLFDLVAASTKELEDALARWDRVKIERTP